jgi:hypothetical protein
MKVLGKFFYFRLIYSLSLLTILILNFSLSQTQEWIVYNTSNSGLSNDYVWAIAIDGQGINGLEHGGGLAKFDGVNWTVYNTSNSGLPENDVNAIAIDGQGNKWIGTWWRAC